MGSAIQPNCLTVQGELESALKKLNIKEKTIFSGRTDKDVHASKQVVSVAIPSFWEDTKKLQTTLQNIINPYIRILSIKKVPNDFHARFSAIKREYRYIISTKKLTPFQKAYLHYKKDIDIGKLKEASNHLLGKRDFEYFSKTGSDPHTTIRTIYAINIYKYKDFVVIKFQANAYLRSQIRMMVDFLLKISNGELSFEDLQNQINKKIMVSNKLAPASGLYLSKIIY